MVFYFANPTGSPKVREAMRQGRIGFIDTPLQGNSRPAGVRWCADNSCFGKDYPGDDAWFGWLEANAGDGMCAFATAPDVVGDAEATRERSAPWLPQIRALGYRAAYVAQNGETEDNVPWDACDVLFLGGIRECVPCDLKWDMEWGKPSRTQKCPQCGRLMKEMKLSPLSYALTRAAHRRGKRVHMGRVNSELRMKIAQGMGCDSADGTYLRFGPDKNLPKLLAWTDGQREREKVNALFLMGVYE